MAGAIFVGIDLLFTAVSLFLAPAATQIGGVRPTDTIPAHELAMVGLGVVLGAGAAAFYGRRGLPLVLLTVALIVLLDLDHIPAYMGMAQPIRPAHSVVFIILVLGLIGATVRRLDVSLVVLSAFLGHLAVDSGIVPPLSPFSFEYASIDPYRALFLVGAVLAALGAGFLVRRSARGGTSVQGAATSGSKNDANAVRPARLSCASGIELP